MRPLDDLFTEHERELLRQHEDERAREAADPEHEARLRKRLLKAEQQAEATELRIAQEIADGLRDEDGDWIDEEDDEDLE